MPEICRFFGAIITMIFRGTYNPPHFHVTHGDDEGLIGINEPKEN